MIRTYSDLRRLATFEDRFHYLSLKGTVGQSTFGFDRYINQRFYTSKQWRDIRHEIIVRDNGCDLASDGHEVVSRLIIHHLNPMAAIDITSGGSGILDPEFLITTTHQTHNAIHYGDESLLARPRLERRPGDTKMW